MKWCIVVALAVVSALPAQSPPAANGATKPAVPGKRDAARIDERAQTMREQIGDGRALQSHVRVAVRLVNGNKLIGVVKDGRLVERVDGLRFVDAQARDHGAGIRLWYTGGKRNWVFVPFLDFAEYEVLQMLSNKQLDTIEEEMQMEERRAVERAALATQRQLAMQPQPAPGGETQEAEPAPEAVADGDAAAKKPAGATKDQGAVDPAKVQQLQQRTWFALLQEYPPAAGWGKARRDEIARRKIVVGAQPSAAELRFVEVFEQWQKACAHFDLGGAAKPAGEPVDDDKPARRTRRGR